VLTSYLYFSDVTNTFYCDDACTAQQNDELAKDSLTDSYGAESFAPASMPIVTVADAGPATCDLDQRWYKAESTWQALGLNPYDYHHIEFLVSYDMQWICGWGGVAYLGGWYTAVASGALSTRYHEFGHNFGLHHSGYGTSEYGDWTDVMGSAHTLSAVSRLLMDWIPSFARDTLLARDFPATYVLRGLTHNPYTASSEIEGVTAFQYGGAVISFDNREQPAKVSVQEQSGLYKQMYILATLEEGQSLSFESIDLQVTSIGEDSATFFIDAPPSPPPSPPSIPLETVWRCWYGVVIAYGDEYSYGSDCMTTCAADATCAGIVQYSNEDYQCYKLEEGDLSTSALLVHGVGLTVEECADMEPATWSTFMKYMLPDEEAAVEYLTELAAGGR